MTSEDKFIPCSESCVCQDYPEERGACFVDEADCCLGCPCDDREALQVFARSVDRLSAAVLLLGQMIDERIYGRSA